MTRRIKYIIRTSLQIVVVAALLSLFSCSSRKNTATTRAFKALNTKYNVYFNAQQAYDRALEQQNSSTPENYNELLPLFLSSSSEGEERSSGPFDQAIEKCRKAIELYSIPDKPKADPSKKNNPKYREWLKKKEFNPFVKNAWMLMAKSHFNNRNYKEASSTFFHISHLYSDDINSVTEARIWLMRIYIERGWLNEADFVSKTFSEQSMSKENLSLFKEGLASLYLKQEEFSKAIVVLEELILMQKDKSVKRRWNFLLGQLCQKVGLNKKAFKAYKSVEGIGTPYDLVFNARMKQSEVVEPGEEQKVLKSLSSMANKGKNRDRLDRIFFAKANIYLSLNDTVKAVDNLILAEEKSTQNGYDKALAQISLADIYYHKVEFDKALPRYTEALTKLSSNEVRYDEVKKREKFLGVVVPFIVEINTQDSLLLLGQKSPKDQLRITQEHIALLKEAEKRNRKKEKDDQMLEKYSERRSELSEKGGSSPAVMPIVSDAASSFYFYNPSVVSQGKSDFEKKWGKRKNEDNWQIKSIRGGVSKEIQDSSIESRSKDDKSDASTEDKAVDIDSKDDARDIGFDPYDVNSYLRKIPTTQEAIAASNAIIEENLFKLAEKYSDEISSLNLSLATYEDLLRRFPDSEFSLESYLAFINISLQKGRKDKADEYRRKLIKQFPNDRLVSQYKNPDYEEQLREMPTREKTLYEEAFTALKVGDDDKVRKVYSLFEKNYPNSSILENVVLLNALTYRGEDERSIADSLLNVIVDNFSETDISIYASNIISQLKEGHTIKSLAHSLGLRFEVDTLLTNSVTQEYTIFKQESGNRYFALFSYNPLLIDRNSLLYSLNDYNFSRFDRKTFDVTFVQHSTSFFVKVEEFILKREVEEYLEGLFQSEELNHILSNNVHSLYISQDNYDILLRESSFDNYLMFYNKELNGKIYRTDVLQSVVVEEEVNLVMDSLPNTMTSKVIVDSSIRVPITYIPNNLLSDSNIQDILMKTPDKLITLRLIKKEKDIISSDAKSISPKEREKLRKQKVKEQERLRKLKLKEQEEKRRAREKAKKANQNKNIKKR